MLKLSLSGRIAEHHATKDRAAIDVATLAGLAAGLGYRGLCIRPSQVTTETPDQRVSEVRAILDRHGLAASMATLHVSIAGQGSAPDASASLRAIGRDVRIAKLLGTTLVRVALKSEADIPRAQRAADEAREHGIRLVHLTHTNSPFETIDECLSMLRRIGRPNFGLVVEPANLALCRQEYGLDALRPLGPHIFNVYVQNVRVRPDGPLAIATRRGPVRYELLTVGDPAGLDLPPFFGALTAVSYEGFVTIHQPAMDGIPTEALARRVYDVIAPLIA